MGSLRLGDRVITPSVIVAAFNEELTVTANGVYTPTGSHTGFSKVTVNVEGITEIVNATNDKATAVSEGDKVWLNKINGAYHIVEFAQVTSDSTIGRVAQGAASGATATVHIFSEAGNIDLSDYTYEDTTGNGDMLLTSYKGTNPDVVIPAV